MNEWLFAVELLDTTYCSASQCYNLLSLYIVWGACLCVVMLLATTTGPYMHVHVHLYNYVTVLYLVVRTYIYTYFVRHTVLYITPIHGSIELTESRTCGVNGPWMYTYVYTQFGVCVHSLIYTTVYAIHFVYVCSSCNIGLQWLLDMIVQSWSDFHMRSQFKSGICKEMPLSTNDLIALAP